MVIASYGHILDKAKYIIYHKENMYLQLAFFAIEICITMCMFI